MSFPSFASGEVLTAADMNAVGLWKVGSVTATSGTTFDLSNCFSANYDAYKVIISNLKLSAVGSISIQLMNGTTPVATNYAWAVMQVAYDASTGPGGSGIPATVSSWATQITGGTIGTASSIDIFNPFQADYTYYQFFSTDNRGVNGYGLRSGGGTHTLSTSYSSLRFTASQTITSATATIYGYRK
jgi:hypothetical protein